MPWFAFATDAENQGRGKAHVEISYNSADAQPLVKSQELEISSWQMNSSSAWAGRALAEHNGTSEYLVRVH